jgi:hypothetical protein
MAYKMPLSINFLGLTSQVSPTNVDAVTYEDDGRFLQEISTMEKGNQAR